MQVLGKSNERILCKLSKSEILRLYSIVHVAMETSKSFISIFFTCQVSACELQPFSCHYLANDRYSQTVKTVFSHLNRCVYSPRITYLEVFLLLQAYSNLITELLLGDESTLLVAR